MKILIEPIMHSEQRYNTCGDYYFDEGPIDIGASDGPTLRIRVSELKDRREVLLIAIHELIEWALCDSVGISNQVIDEFDLVYKGGKEPGDEFQAPYYYQHQVATGIERILAAEMGVDWLAYERHINELSKGDEDEV